MEVEEFEEQPLPLPSSCLPSLRRPLSPFGGFSSPVGTPRSPRPTTTNRGSSSSPLRHGIGPPTAAGGDGEGGGGGGEGGREREEELGRRKFLIASLVREVSWFI